jgi:hypothetical protein
MWCKQFKEVLSLTFKRRDDPVRRFILFCVREYNPGLVEENEFPFFLGIRYCEAFDLLKADTQIKNWSEIFWEAFPEVPYTEDSSQECEAYWYMVKEFNSTLYDKVRVTYFK